jgi:transposase-like protein
VTDLPREGQRFDVTCPHCKKPFAAELIAGGAARHHGFKCPHCKLFVPYQRAEERDLLEPTS